MCFVYQVNLKFEEAAFASKFTIELSDENTNRPSPASWKTVSEGSVKMDSVHKKLKYRLVARPRARHCRVSMQRRGSTVHGYSIEALNVIGAPCTDRSSRSVPDTSQAVATLAASRTSWRLECVSRGRPAFAQSSEKEAGFLGIGSYHHKPEYAFDGRSDTRWVSNASPKHA